jgi:hypothetical protein
MPLHDLSVLEDQQHKDVEGLSFIFVGGEAFCLNDSTTFSGSEAHNALNVVLFDASGRFNRNLYVTVSVPI